MEASLSSLHTSTQTHTQGLSCRTSPPKNPATCQCSALFPGDRNHCPSKRRLGCSGETGSPRGLPGLFTKSLWGPFSFPLGRTFRKLQKRERGRFAPSVNARLHSVAANVFRDPRRFPAPPALGSWAPFLTQGLDPMNRLHPTLMGTSQGRPHRHPQSHPRK